MPTPAHNPLAMQRYRIRKAAIDRQIAQGILTREQGQAQLAAFGVDLIAKVRDREKPPTPTD